MAGKVWKVVGGADKGGILVRTECALNSPEAPGGRLATGAKVLAEEVVGERVRFRKLEGAGPDRGWVSKNLTNKQLLEETDEVPPDAAAPTSPAQTSSPSKGQPAVNAPGGYQERLKMLREKYPYIELDVPYEAYAWTPQELENYFESGGFIKPVSYQRSSGQAFGGAPPSPSKPAKEETPQEKRRRERKANIPDVPQFSTNEALQIQEQLRQGFTDKKFQDQLHKLSTQFPKRKERGHPDGPAYFEAFETHVCTVYHQVLPKYGLDGDWEGVRMLTDKMAEAMTHPKVKKNHEELNTALGLPRDAVLRGSSKEEMFQFRGDGDAPVAGYPRPLVVDADGDEGHEFFVEDIDSSELTRQGPSSLDSDCWYRVVHKPSVALRAQPDVKSEAVGKKNFGERIRVQKVVDAKWCRLHEAECRKVTKGKEAWVLINGAEVGLGVLLERVS
eukprot:gnl/TRDRNA2_/TRDRNA2_167399_c1_seq1.p1 gnl/TRDRNA2_/TRDRNA2_167399_c1~~gnl/TRDRNA2_/TRDRNA2_167399_c1_seq1.p1  ORF type:complete len:459 (+),score=96.43 gnl/TRDRNA2_/TRDRNA2_167399_c1_seq1:41-1378(+)